MTPSRPRARKGVNVVSRADWKRLVALALACCADARAAASGVELGRDAADRLAALAHGVRRGGPSVALFAAEAGFATSQAAEAFVTAARAFARPETPSALRAALAAPVEALARFLDEALTRMTDRAFAVAHAHRPEVL